jgi:hypothetical protein
MSKQPGPHRLPRLCLFCDRNANSAEHMWSDWMGPHFAKGAHDKSHESFTRLSQSAEFLPSDRILHGHPTTRKLRVVCRNCNNGWMSQLESAAKPYIEPMIIGRRVQLNEAAQRIVTDWIALKIIVWEPTDQRGTVFKRAQTLAFSGNRTLPDNLKIWLFRTQIPNFAHITRAFTALFKTSDVSISDREIPNTQTVLFGIGQLVIWVVYSEIAEFELSKHSQRFAKALWPPYRHTLLWPPMQTLNGVEIRHLGLTLGRYLDAVGTPLR